VSPEPYVVHDSAPPLELWNDPVRGAVTWRTLFSGDRTPTEALTMGVAEVTPGAGQPLRIHRHAHPEAYYILSGHGVLRIDGIDHALSPGTAAFIPGGAPHGARALGDAPLRILYVFAADAFDQIEYSFPETADPERV